MKKQLIKLLSVLAMIALFSSLKPEAIHATPLVGTIFVNDDVGDGLVGHWKFDENGNPTALDFAGPNHAVLQDTATLSNANLPALAVPNLGSLALDGANDYAQINAPTAALALTTSFTVTAWVRRAATNQYDAIFDSGTQAGKWWIFIADNGVGKVNRLGFGERGILEVYSTQSIVDTNWHHIAVVKSGDAGNNISFFVDGAASGSAAVGSVSAHTGSARMGALLDVSVVAQFGGNLDDLRVYNRALSAAEITRLSLGQGCVTDGTSWATAYRELQCALVTASAGDEIWLAGGTYRPGTGSGVSFNLVNGVNLLGGFTGSETLASQRPAFDPNAVETNLTGDILGNDNPIGFINYTENSHNVLIAGPGVSATLDGLAIRQGNNDVGFGVGAGLQVQAGAVGMTLNNVVVSGSSANSNGGGIHSQAPLSLINVTLTGNRSANGDAGGLFSSAGVTASNLQALGNTGVTGGGIRMTAPLIITGGLFDNNRAVTFFGGAIDTNADLTVNGVTFNNNQAPFGGGAIESSGPTLSITNSTFTNNQASIFTGGAVEAFGIVNIATSTFSGNRSTQNGGAIFTGSGVLTVNTSTFNNNQASGGNCLPVCSSGSGGAIAALGDLIISGTTFTNNTARLDGGAISASGAATSVTFSDLNSNQAGFPAGAGNPGLGRGGAIFSEGVLTLDNTNAGSNGAQASGGAIYSVGTLVIISSDFQLNSAAAGGGLFSEGGGTIANSGIHNNTATNLGGGLALSAGTLSLSGVTMNSNTVLDVAGQGGGLHIGAGTVTINVGSFTSNTAAQGGGLFNAGTLVTHGVTFTTNTASLTGGGLYNAGTMADSASILTGNQAVNGGGAAFAAGTSTSGHGSFNGTVFTGNTATDGGGLHSINEVTLTDVTFSGNQATTPNGDGGGLFTSGGVSNLTGVSFANNTAGRFGGGAQLNAAIIQGSSFSGNSAISEGGGARLINASDVIASIFTGNSSNLSGGLVMQGTMDRSQTLRVINSLFYDNRRIASSGAADLRLFDLTIELVNNTFARPGLAGQPSVAFFRSNLTAENNIWNGYQTSLIVGQSAVGTTILEDYNLFFNAPLDASVPPGTHGLTADPQFADPLATNFRLKSNSPAIDAGNNSALPPAILTDLANLPRFIDTPGTPNTGVGTPPVDRGAFEFSLLIYLPAVVK